jgi:hypothetical protein
MPNTTISYSSATRPNARRHLASECVFAELHRKYRLPLSATANERLPVSAAGAVAAGSGEGMAGLRQVCVL